MSEKLRPNFTPIPNVILDQIMRGLNEGELKTLMAICRYTYGWGKQSDQISLNQLADLTGMNRSNVARSRKRLGNLLDVTPGTATTASTYRLNIEISESDLAVAASKGSDHSATSDPSAASVKGSDPSATFQRKPKKEDKTVAKAPGVSFPISKKRKLTRPDPAQCRAFESWYSAYPKRVGKKPALKAWLKLNPDHSLIETINAATARYLDIKAGVEPCFIKDPDRWLNEERWTDEATTGAANGRANSEAKDLGNGLVEFDGLKMTIKDYERKHGSRSK